MVSEWPLEFPFEVPLSWPLEVEFAKYWPNLDFLFMLFMDEDKGELYMTSFSGLFLAVSYFVLNFGGFDNECRNYEEK